jgi:hypothetical protein
MQTMKDHISISLPSSVKTELAEVAARQGGSASDLAAYAIRRYLDWRREADSKVPYSGDYSPSTRRKVSPKIKGKSPDRGRE